MVCVRVRVHMLVLCVCVCVCVCVYVTSSKLKLLCSGFVFFYIVGSISGKADLELYSRAKPYVLCQIRNR